MKEIHNSCSQCGGTGVETISKIVDGEIVPQEEITCRTCYGSGLVSNLALSDDLITLFVDMKDEIDSIKEKVDEIKGVVDGL